MSKNHSKCKNISVVISIQKSA